MCGAKDAFGILWQPGAYEGTSGQCLCEVGELGDASACAGGQPNPNNCLESWVASQLPD